MKKVLIVAVMFMMPTLASATVVQGITDDFSGDLSQWKRIDFQTPANASITYTTESGRLKQTAVTSNTSSYVQSVLVTNDSVAVVDSKLSMSTVFNAPSTTSVPKSYPAILLTVNNTATTDEYLHRNAFELLFTEGLNNIWLRAYYTGMTVNAEVRLASTTQSSLGWSILANKSYEFTFDLDQSVNQLTLTAVSLDGTAIVNGQSTASAVLTYTSSIYEASSYYAAYGLNSKSYTGTQTENVYADDFVMGVPEPTSMAIILLGGIAAISHKRRK